MKYESIRRILNSECHKQTVLRRIILTYIHMDIFVNLKILMINRNEINLKAI